MSGIEHERAADIPKCPACDMRCAYCSSKSADSARAAERYGKPETREALEARIKLQGALLEAAYDLLSEQCRCPKTHRVHTHDCLLGRYVEASKELARARHEPDSDD